MKNRRIEKKQMKNRRIIEKKMENRKKAFSKFGMFFGITLS